MSTCSLDFTYDIMDKTFDIMDKTLDKNWVCVAACMR